MTRQKIRRVAVIGAGVSGVVAAGHLLQSEIDVVVFERNEEAGGVWLYDERQPLEPTYPSVKASVADGTGISSHSDEENLVLQHAPPGPCYVSLQNNVSTPLMKTKLSDWPAGTPDFVSHPIMKQYIQDISQKTGVELSTIYGARVTDVVKSGRLWKVTWSSLRKNSLTKIESYSQVLEFDAVVVASGHYHAPRIPDIPGLSAAKARWPHYIMHSKGYRTPDRFRDNNVLLIGGGVSSIDIARDIGPTARTVYQSTRNGEFDLAPSMLPDNGTRVSEISHFEFDTHGEKSTGRLPLVVHLQSGQKLCDIDDIIICTGYHITLPFLRQYHDDATAPEDASDSILVTDGMQVHNLHKDIFYIPDPTLAFIGVPYYTATFSLFEFQAIALAAVFSEVAPLPTDMRSEYLDKVRRIGYGRNFHSLKDGEEAYVRDLMEWVNVSRRRYGLALIEGHTPAWHRAKAAQRERIKAFFGQ
ncbi:hypothetical protein FE257_001298 [Aspergillus nanangensis]|uniref:Uncharacterized protein n=1 Tax=Aspergillus nanangensis TaxID=2582783 RepID=A0AAD4CE17_ASPNN|nr:hypothetical protein FE257_001298 [Aspergillus nanangensis]